MATTYVLTPSVTSQTEGNQVVFTITRTGTLPLETIWFSAVAETASYTDGDYTMANGTQPLNIAVSFASGATSATVTMAMVSDGKADSGQTFRTIVQRNSTDLVGTFLAQSSSVTINDAASPTSYSVSPSVTTQTEGNQVTFTISRSGSTPAETVWFSAVAETASYTDGDYTMANGAEPLNIAVSFASGATSATVTMAIVNDGKADSGQTFRTIVQRNSTDLVGTFLAQSSSITINDSGQNTTYSLTPGTVTVNENVGTVTFTVTRSGGTPAETVFVSTVEGASAGFATNSGDYTGKLNQQLTFAAGEVSKTVTISITNDSTAEPDETFGLIVQRNSTDLASTYLAKSTFSIHDDDGVATTYSLTPGTVTVNENVGTVTFTITRSGGTPAETVFVSTVEGASAGFATNSGDYTGKLNQQLTFAAGEVSKTVTISITNDSTAEPDETFGLIVQQNSTDLANTYLAKSTFTIHDDDQSLTTTYTITPGSPTVNEGDGTLTFTITRSGILTVDTIYVSTAQTEGFLNSNDYTPITSQALSFSSGQTSQTVTVSIINDSVAEQDEKFGLIVQRNPGDPARTFLAKSIFTVADNDATTTDDYTSSVTTSGTISVGGTAQGNIQWLGDTDWFGITLAAGATYKFDLDGLASGQGTLVDPFLRIRDSAGNPVLNAYSDDGGAGYDSRLAYKATSSGAYYLAVGTGYHIDGTGTYTLHATLDSTQARD